MKISFILTLSLFFSTPFVWSQVSGWTAKEIEASHQRDLESIEDKKFSWRKIGKTLEKQTKQSDVPDVRTAKRLARRHLFESQIGMSERERLSVIGVYQVGRPIPKIGAKGDLIWLLYVMEEDLIKQIVVVNANSSSVYLTFPYKIEH